MTGRPHKERLLNDLKEIRGELVAEAQKITPEQFDWAPAPDMKTFKALLQEIGTMERLCARWLTRQTMLDWETAVAWSGGDAPAILADLETIRAETRDYLNGCTEEQLQTPVPLPLEWHQYMGPSVEPEELLRWVTRHEYYHLGQIITYRWILGDNPYKPV